MSFRLDTLFRDESGVTTAGMGVSLAVCLTLVFSGAQLYRATSASSEIQEVADVAALAAENEVAEFMVAVRLSDAAVLSMTLFACSMYGMGIVAACVPPLAALSEQMISMASKTVESRDRFAERAAEGLNRLQKMLPFLSAASAAGIAEANNNGAMRSDYVAIAVLVPQQGEEISIGLGDGLSMLGDAIEAEAPAIRDMSADAEVAAKLAREAKDKAYMYDCGNSPGYCLYERAGRFSWMPDSENPYYSSVDTWSFSVALERARSYYSRRYSMEAQPSGGVSEKASYHLRKLFYKYALEEIESKGFVADDGDSFSANFPKLYRNTSEFRQTSLYRDAVFPVSGDVDGNDGFMHAYEGCPANEATVCWDPLMSLDCEAQRGCPVCNFSTESLGNVASASTNIANGFEHHYEQIRMLAQDYQAAREKLDPLVREVKDRSNPLLDQLKSVMGTAANSRISAQPPGSNGAVAMVVNRASNAADTGFESSLVGGGATLGARAAVSAAALVEDSSHESSSLITSLLDGLEGEGGAALGAARIALDCWSAMLKAYEDGQNALDKALSDGIGSMSTNSESGLGSWASNALKDAVSAVGLQPAELKALKPAILNTGHVADSDDGAFSVRFRQVKSAAMASMSPATDLFSMVCSGIEGAIKGVSQDGSLTIAEIELPMGGAKLPIVIALPESSSGKDEGFVSACVSAVSAVIGIPFDGNVWQ